MSTIRDRPSKLLLLAAILVAPGMLAVRASKPPGDRRAVRAADENVWQ
jgi:hypothetical protein